MYVSAAALLLLLVVLIIILIHTVRHRAVTPEDEPSPEPAEETEAAPWMSRKPMPFFTPPIPPSASPEVPVPAITPPAITAADPASGSDIILRPVKPSTNTDIDAPE